MERRSHVVIIIVVESFLKSKYIDMNRLLDLLLIALIW